MSHFVRLRNRNYRQLLLSLAEHSLLYSSGHFYEEIDRPIRSYFDADSLSVWESDPEDTLHNRFFSTKSADPKLTYRPGEGITGSTFARREPILAHRMSDVKQTHGIIWVGKVSDFDQAPTDGDHGIFVPILSVDPGDGRQRKCLGVVRLISYSQSSSFWPHDLQAAQTIAEVIGLRISHDHLLERLQTDKRRLITLFQLSADMSRLGIVEKYPVKVFDSLVNEYNARNIAHFIHHSHGRTDGTEVKYSTFPEDIQDRLSKTAIRCSETSSDKVLFLGDRRHVAVVLGKDNLSDWGQLCVFLFELYRDLDDVDFSFLNVFAAMLEIAWQNEHMYAERQEILEKVERAEAATRGDYYARVRSRGEEPGEGDLGLGYQ